MEITKGLVALVISFGVTLGGGLFLIPWLLKLKVGQTVRMDGPKRHLKKSGTPTMGGIIFLLGLTVTLIIFRAFDAKTMLLLVTTLLFGLVGFLDDFIKVVLRRPLGLRAREKLLGQVIFSLLLAFGAVAFLGRGTDWYLPFSRVFFEEPRYLELGNLFFFAATVFIMVGSANAVNLTDGLDGLCSSVTLIVMSFFALVSLALKEQGLFIFSMALIGGLFGFLVFNRHPAKVFMGDTGSLALGAAVAGFAVLTQTELFLPLVGIIYVVETLSVIIQVASYQLTGKRIFKMSPLHHHFELSGWSENKIVLTFTLVTLIMVFLSGYGL
ncbi:phospho-N-acetylmuramoyl-pentapeptide-transferase [Carboxydothermus pertinax]|uniref:Phospho-N-acetylmuramoyl-pentapeptide-transferase n=1 Tax=Carboxydothermus pertinax TaxID=870242 RepID=A0A1L8CS81_9THEO|nr:phospho-N-acetylmuramoyl-pentapeptide-transferase [Carboxydothermus pertinax]GAV21772.1 phospho-N-acetylmuramoyl-pentapeptide-transferase [Carboxydothermus pertinax]